VLPLRNTTICKSSRALCISLAPLCPAGDIGAVHLHAVQQESQHHAVVHVSISAHVEPTAAVAGRLDGAWLHAAAGLPAQWHAVGNPTCLVYHSLVMHVSFRVTPKELHHVTSRQQVCCQNIIYGSVVSSPSSHGSDMACMWCRQCCHGTAHGSQAVA
jgi:hypothetical protein